MSWRLGRLRRSPDVGCGYILIGGNPTGRVDLNPIRATIAETPETSDYTGAKDRIDDLNEREDRTRPSTHDGERSRRRRKSGWMSPIEINEKEDPLGACIESSGRRASSKGFLSVTMARYLDLLDWTGRQLKADKVGVILDHLAPILTRIGLDTTGWYEVVSKFGQGFKRAAETPESLTKKAIRCGQHWLSARDTRWVDRPPEERRFGLLIDRSKRDLRVSAARISS